MRKLNKVLLINPLGTPVEFIAPPLGLAFLVSYARRFFPGTSFKIFDFEVNKTPFAKQMQIIKGEKPDIVGLTGMTTLIAGAQKLARLIKEYAPHITVIVGGPHVTALGAVTSPHVDSSVIGEGEQAFVELLKIWESGVPLPKIHSACILTDIDFFPAHDLINFHNYMGYHPVKYRPQAGLFWSRGCIFNCTYCSNAVWKKCNPRVRYRTPKNIVDEIELLNHNYGIRQFYVCDDMVNINPDWLMNICDEIIRRKLKIIWRCNLHCSEKLTPEPMFAKMKEGGCWIAGWGIESGEDYVLKNIKKGRLTCDVYRALKLAHKAGLINDGGFLFGSIWRDHGGNPTGETYENIKKTINFAKELRDMGILDYVQFNIYTPYAGSEMWEIVREFDLAGRADRQEWKDWGMDTHAISFVHPHLSPEKLMALHKEAWISFVLSPSLFIRQFLRVRSLADLGALFSIIWGVFRVIFRGHARKKVIHADCLMRDGDGSS